MVVILTPIVLMVVGIPGIIYFIMPNFMMVQNSRVPNMDLPMLRLLLAGPLAPKF